MPTKKDGAVAELYHPDVGHPLARGDNRFAIVGLGASAGGLQALITFFEQVPVECDMAFVVILHLSPDHPSEAAAILQLCTGTGHR